jgi:uncharacterized integral membrane protein
VSNLPDRRPDPVEPGIPWRSILTVVAGLYAVVFLFLNNDQVEISFVFFKAETSLFFLILLSMGLGAVLAIFGPAWWRRRQRLKKLDPKP